MQPHPSSLSHPNVLALKNSLNAEEEEHLHQHEGEGKEQEKEKEKEKEKENESEGDAILLVTEPVGKTLEEYLQNPIGISFC